MGDEENDKASKYLRKLYYVTNGMYVWIAALISFGSLPIFIEIGYGLNPNNIIIASTGVLTFIAIFYSLLISKEGETVMNKIEKITKLSREELKQKAHKKIDKAKNFNKSLTKIMQENQDITIVKILTRIDIILLIAVTSFLISILFSLFYFEIFYKISYSLFLVGLSCSSGIVFEWTFICNVVKGFKETV